MIPKAVLEQLDIPLPDLATQSRIMAIHALAMHESALLRKLAERRERLTSLSTDGASQASRTKKEPCKNDGTGYAATDKPDGLGLRAIPSGARSMRDSTRTTSL